MVVGGAVADCLSKCGSSFVARSSSSSICGIGLRLNLNSNLTRTIRPRRAVVGLCVASLITNSDSFEVGRLIGSYGFMNVTSYSGLQSGMGMDYAVLEDIRNFKVQDIGEGSVKISSVAGFMKVE